MKRGATVLYLKSLTGKEDALYLGNSDENIFQGFVSIKNCLLTIDKDYYLIFGVMFLDC